MPRSRELPAPIIDASGLRVDVDGSAAIDGVSLTSTGEWVLVLGAARAFFEAASGLRGVERGALLVDGAPAIEAIRAGAAAGAPLDPLLPPRWSVREYVTWSARLAGHARGSARAMAVEALERLQLSEHASARLGTAPLTVRRGAVLAAAVATGAPVLLVEDPTAGLADDVAHAFARTIASGLSDRRAAFFAARIPLESPIALAADEAIVLDGSYVAAQGAPAEIAAAERAFTLHVAGDVSTFVEALQAKGGLLLTPAPVLPMAIATHLSVNLGPLGTRDLLRLAADCHAIVVELRPLAGAFA